MRLRHYLAAVAVAGAALTGAACTAQVDGHGTLAAGAPPTLFPSGSASPSGSPAGSPAASPSASAAGSPTASPRPSAAAVEAKRRLTCVLVQATVRSTNDRFNAAKSRASQISILRAGVDSLGKHLGRSGLARQDKIYAASAGVRTELTKLVTAANEGASPSTAPYNAATRRLTGACNSV